MESRFVTPSKGVAIRDGALGSIPKITFVFSSKRVNKVNKVNLVNQKHQVNLVNLVNLFAHGDRLKC